MTDLRPVVLACPGRHRHDAVGLITAYVILLFAVPSQLVVGAVGAAGTPANAVGMLALMWWGTARLVPDLGVARGLQPLRIALLILWTSALASYAAGGLTPMHPLQVNAADRAILSMLCWSGVVLLIADGACCRARLDVLVRRMVVVLAAFSAAGIYQYFTGVNIAELVRIPGLVANQALEGAQMRFAVRRVSSTAIHPIEFGVVLATVLPLAVHDALHGGARRFLPRWAPMGLIALGAVLSVSRSAIVGIVVGSLALYPTLSRQQRRLAIVLAPLAAVAVQAVAPGVLGTIRFFFANLLDDPSVTSRTDDYSFARDLFSGAPWLGRGMGTFLPELYVLPGGRGGGSLILDNQYLHSVLQVGAVGVAALLLFFSIAAFSARGARRRTSNPAGGSLGQALFAAILVPMVTFATFDALSFSMAAGITFLIAGCSGAAWRLAREEESARACSGPAPAGISPD